MNEALAGDPVPADEPHAARVVRRLDELLGKLVGLALMATMLLLIGTAVLQVVLDKVAERHPTWPGEIIRYSVLFAAMAGAALAAHRQGMFNMDLVTRRFGARVRSLLRISTAALVAALCVLVILRAVALRANSFQTTQDHEVVSIAHGYVSIILGFGMIGLHYLLHGVIEAIYLASGRLPPEPPHGGH